MRSPLPVMLSFFMLLAGPPGATLAADLPEAVRLPSTPPWPAGPDGDALTRALHSTHCGQAPPTARTRAIWREAGPGIHPIPFCRCLRATAVALNPPRFLALGAEAARRGTPAWHAAVGDAVDALPDAAVQACLERQRR
jgi:hypothetical protein